MIAPDPLRPQRLAADPGASVWVAASAGTGKTKVLTDRVLSLLLAGTKPSRILCLTFTRAAAAEMSDRIARRLSAWAATDGAALDADLEKLTGAPPDAALRERARRLFVAVLDAPGGLAIQTLHGFGQALLRRFPLEAGLAPHFTVMDARDATEMLNNSVDAVLSAARRGDGDIAAALAVVSSHVHETLFPDLIGELVTARGRLRRLLTRHGGVTAAIAHAAARLGLAAETTPERIVAQAVDAVDEPALRRIARALAKGAKTDGERGAALLDWLAGDDDQRRRAFDDYAGIFLTDKGDIRQTLATKGAQAADPGVTDVLRAEAERLLAVNERCRAAVTLTATSALLRLGEAFLDAYQQAKRRRALLDYDDLIEATRDLLRRPGIAAWVLYKLDGGIDHILIDEAQDTNPEQWEVVEALAEEFFAGRGARDIVRTVFAVGDAKQSIFSFQRADPAAFARMRAHFARRVPEAGQVWRPVEMIVSFRSTRAVLEAVDAVFARSPAGDGVVEPDAVIAHVPWRSGDGGAVELWPPVEARGEAEPDPWKPPVERLRLDSPRARLARLVAAKIAAMIDGREILAAHARPIEAGDVMILVRRRDALVEDLVRELKARRVAVAGVDRMVLVDQLAVQDLMAAGRFALLPEDDLNLACLLKSPLIGLAEDALFDLAHDRPGSLWAEVIRRAAHRADVAEAHARLTALLARADQTPPFEFYAELLGPRDGRRRLLARLGAEAEDALDEFLDQALAYERAHAPSLEGFLFWLERGAVEIKRDLDTGHRGAVRIMTVHGAKGLQAPIVFLPDTLRVPAKGPKLLWPGEGADEMMLWPPRKDHEEAVAIAERQRRKQLADEEYRRLLYVAMTRAEDRLIVCGWRRKPGDDPNWYNLVRQGLSDLAVPIRDDFLAAEGETDSVEVLRHACPQTRVVAATERDMGPIVAPAPLPDWARTPPDPEPRPPKPLAPSRPDDEPTVRSPRAPIAGDPFRRGLWAHRLLQSLPELTPTARGPAARRWLARTARDLDPGQRESLAAEVLAVLDSPEAAPAFGSASRAEVPLVGIVGGQAIAGQVDRLAVTPEAVWVVDYKTNRDPPARVSEVPTVYLRQMAAYRSLLRDIFPGKTVRCALLWTLGPRWMVLPDDRLDAHAP